MSEFSQLARHGDEVFGLTVALYPTDFPTLPPAEAAEGADTEGEVR